MMTPVNQLTDDLMRAWGSAEEALLAAGHDIGRSKHERKEAMRMRAALELAHRVYQEERVQHP